jgi:hypothetical protein|tara:strand:- start:196 stop:561 length:366 start_codon:yes stop_codon:yes gene_type:complete
MKKLLLSLSVIGLLISCGTGGSNSGKSIKKSNEYYSTVSVCRHCQLVVTHNDMLYPKNKTVSINCNQWQGHLWYNAGTSGNNRFYCRSCEAKVSIFESKPRCMSHCEEACNGVSKHDWVAY